MGKRGFTLLEILLVIAIIGILTTLILPNFSRSQISAKIVTHNTNVKLIKSAAAMYLIDNPINNNEIRLNYEDLKYYLDEDSNFNIDPIILKNIKTTSASNQFIVEINNLGKITVVPGELSVKGNEIIVGSKVD